VLILCFPALRVRGGATLRGRLSARRLSVWFSLHAVLGMRCFRRALGVHQHAVPRLRGGACWARESVTWTLTKLMCGGGLVPEAPSPGAQPVCISLQCAHAIRAARWSSDAVRVGG